MINNKPNITKLYVCLGNVGKEYEQTRHNAGFLFGEKYIEQLHNSGNQMIIKEENLYKLVSFPQENISFLFPKTLMNLSGKAVNEYLAFTNKVFDLIVVHDDLDLLIGDFKMIIGKGPKTHNGLSSVEDALQTKDFERIRIGIENRNGLEISGLDYVLYRFSQEELGKIYITVDKIIELLNKESR